MGKKLTSWVIGFVLLLTIIAPKASLAESIFDVTVTIGGQEYEVHNEGNSFELNIDELMNEFGIEETEKLEKISIQTPDGVKAVEFHAPALSTLIASKIIEVENNQVEYVVADVLGNYDGGSDGVALKHVRELLYPVNYQTYVTATVYYEDDTIEYLEILVAAKDELTVPATNNVKLNDIKLVTTDGKHISATKLADNKFQFNLAGNNGGTEVKEVQFTSDSAATLSFFSNNTPMYMDETDIKFVGNTAVMNVDKLDYEQLQELVDIIGELPTYLFTLQDVKYSVAYAGQTLFNGYVAAADGSESPFQVEFIIDGWVKEKGLWYYYDIEGNKVKGWLEDNGDWYYLDPTTGAMQTGWEQVGKYWYYFASNGVMQTGMLTVDGKTYILADSGKMLTGWAEYNGEWYYLASSGEMKTGWVKPGSTWYFLDYKSGVMATGWAKVGQDWFFFTSDGAMQTGWEQVAGKWYFLATNGAMETGWVKDGKWFYLANSGEMATGWQKIGGKWYLFGNSGAMNTGWAKDAGKWYFLDNSGAMETGWVKVSGKWYFFNNSGTMQTGWVAVGSKWYYFYNSGAMAANTVIDGYRLAGSGAWIR